MTSTDCVLFELWITELADGGADAMGGERAIKMNEHVATCDECRELAATLMLSTGLEAAAGEVERVSDARDSCAKAETNIAAWHDGTLTDNNKATLGAHLERCGVCRQVITTMALSISETHERQAAQAFESARRASSPVVADAVVSPRSAPRARPLARRTARADGTADRDSVRTSDTGANRVPLRRSRAIIAFAVCGLGAAATLAVTLRRGDPTREIVPEALPLIASAVIACAASAPGAIAPAEHPAEHECKVGRSVVLAERVRTDVALVRVRLGAGLTAIGYAVDGRAKATVLDANGDVVDHGEFEVAIPVGSRISRVAPLAVGGGRLRAMIDVIASTGARGTTLHCNVSGDRGGDAPSETISECRSFADAGVGWVVAAHVRQDSDAVVVEERLLAYASTTVLARSVPRPLHTPAVVADGSTDSNEPAPRSTAATAPLLAADYAHFLVPESIRVGAWFLAASFEGGSLLLMQSRGNNVVATRLGFGSDVAPAAMANEDGRVVVVIPTRGALYATSFDVGSAPSPPKRVELGAGSSPAVGRAAGVSLLSGGSAMVAYLGANDRKVYVTELDADLQPKLGTPVEVGAEAATDLRIHTLHGRTSMVTYLDASGILKAAVVRCGE